MAPKLVPRPIPGLELPLPEDLAAPFFQAGPAAASPEPPSSSSVEVKAAASDQTQARVVYIRRRSTLPEKYTKDLPKPAASKQPAAGKGGMPVQVSSGAVKIIPKSEVADRAKPEARP